MHPLKQLRLNYHPRTPHLFKEIRHLQIESVNKDNCSSSPCASFFPYLSKQERKLTFKTVKELTHKPKRVGVVLSGGQAPGGHNVITGLFDALMHLHPESHLVGFKLGPKGIVENQHIHLTKDLLSLYCNQGGFDLIGSGRTKIETPEQFQAAEKTVKALELDGLVIIGGDDSNTNAAMLAEYFLENNCPTSVVGVPKTIDGDLKNEEVEISFGFDSATKTYSEIIGNIARDALSARKYYFFIKLMGRSASHITLECALKTHPNIALIGEEIAEQKKTLAQVTSDICDVIGSRANQGKDFGVILIPEGIVEFIPEFKTLIQELNALTSARNASDVRKQLGSEALACFDSLPSAIQEQLLLDRDPHGNVQVSKIETERLFIDTVSKELENRKQGGKYKGKFSAQPLFCGYEGRSCFPSNFDADYCYTLGHIAALLIQNNSTGYICTVKNLAHPVEMWDIGALNLIDMMGLEKRGGKQKPVIGKALTNLKGKAFAEFVRQRCRWAIEDDYQYPGPIQFFGPHELTNSVPLSLLLDTHHNSN